MIRQSFRFAFRSFKKTGVLHGLNIVGLALGLCVFFLVSLFIYQEKSYERDFEKKGQTFQVSHTMLGLKMAMGSPNLPYVLHEIPEVIEFTNFTKTSMANVSWQDQERTATILTVDSSFFKVFDFDLLYGDREIALDKARSAIISEEKAIEFFGTTDVLGKLMSIQRYKKDSAYQVGVIIKGVSRTPRFKTQMKFDFLVSEHRPVNADLPLGGWQNSSTYNYVVAAPNVTTAELDKRLFDLSYKYVYPKTVPSGGLTESEWKEQALYCGFYAESLSDLRVNSDTSNNLMPPLNTAQLETLFIIALAALIISVFNFINISTARASLRMKEVGVKRILGSSKGRLVFQFMLESFMLILLSSIISLAVVEGMVQLKPGYIGLEIEYSVLHSQEWAAGLITFILCLTILAGIYPAVYLSSGKLVSILKNGVPKHSFSVLNASALRKGATVLQFIFSIGLITAVITMFLQVDHLKTRDLGYEGSSVIVIDNTHELGPSKNTFRNELLKLSSVTAVAYSNRLPSASTFERDQPVKINDSTEIGFSLFQVDPAFFDVMSMKFVGGKAFDDRPSVSIESNEASGEATYFPVVINEVAAKLMGHDNAVGQLFRKKGMIIGVVNDFVFSDLRQQVGPVMLVRKSSQGRHTYHFPLSIKTNDSFGSLDEIQEVWSGFSENELKYHLLASNYDQLLEVEQKGFRAVLTFSVVAVIISCLGLLGLAMFTVDQRIHEFGIRKVLGASMQDIIKLFGTGFAKLMLIAFLLALPVSFISMQNWLSGYADRIALDSSIFVLTAVLVTIIVTGTILFQSMKAGRLNPVDTLRSE